VPTGKAFCAFRLLFVQSRCFRPVPIPKRSASIRSTKTQATASNYLKVDADTGEEVSNEDLMKGYKVDTDTYVEVSKEELENIALESTRTIDIDEFVPKNDIDPRYLIRPITLCPTAKLGTTLLR
jgi:non-homologous end joining protein Ku